MSGISDTMTPDHKTQVVYYFDGDGNAQAVDPDHPLPTGGGEGAAAADPALLAAVDGLEALLTAIGTNTDGLEPLLTALGANTDGIEGALATLHGDVDGVETKLDTLITAVVDSRDPDGTATTNDDVVVDATAGGVQILAANANRKGFIVQNTSANNIRVAINGAPTATKGIQLKAGESLSMSAPYCPVGAIKAIREGANSGACAAIEVV